MVWEKDGCIMKHQENKLLETEVEDRARLIAQTTRLKYFLATHLARQNKNQAVVASLANNSPFL